MTYLIYTTLELFCSLPIVLPYFLLQLLWFCVTATVEYRSGRHPSRLPLPK